MRTYFAPIIAQIAQCSAHCNKKTTADKKKMRRSLCSWEWELIILALYLYVVWGKLRTLPSTSDQTDRPERKGQNIGDNSVIPQPSKPWNHKNPFHSIYSYLWPQWKGTLTIFLTFDSKNRNVQGVSPSPSPTKSFILLITLLPSCTYLLVPHWLWGRELRNTRV